MIACTFEHAVHHRKANTVLIGKRTRQDQIHAFLILPAQIGEKIMGRTRKIMLSEEDHAHLFPRLLLRRLRLLYAAGGLIALIEFGLCCLQNSMFTRTADETGVTIVQNYSIDALPFLSYDLLSVLSAVLTALLVGLLVFIFIWMRRKSR